MHEHYWRERVRAEHVENSGPRSPWGLGFAESLGSQQSERAGPDPPQQAWGPRGALMVFGQSQSQAPGERKQIPFGGRNPNLSLQDTQILRSREYELTMKIFQTHQETNCQEQELGK